MKKIIWLLPFVLLALVPNTYAWKWKTHYDVVEAAFNALPPEVRNNLNLDEIKRGSIAPDKDDFGHPHTYPNTLFQALYWLENARKEYSAGRYGNASYALGVASHFIADSTVVPYHNVQIENFELHDEYEAIGAQFEPAPPSYIENFFLPSSLGTFNENADDRLSLWIASGSDKRASMVKEDIDRAATFTYNAWVHKLGIVQGSEGEAGISIDMRLIAAIALVVLVIIVIGMKRFHRA